MSERWLRLYEGVVNDPKMQRLPGEVFKGLINLWCVANANDGALPSVDDLAFALRTTAAKVEALLATLIDAGLIDEDETGMRPHNWNGRQFKSDVSSNRVKRYRERKKAVSGNGERNGDETLHETPPDTDTDTEEETPSLRSGSKKAGKRLPEDWRPSETDVAYARSQGVPEAEIWREGERFLDFWLGKPGQGGVKLDWSATWRNWVRSACDRKGWKPSELPLNGASLHPTPPKDERDAEGRLNVGRERQMWPRPRWGPAPGEAGCTIPPHLIKPSDHGWGEWSAD